jgi:hypothetical protein
MATLPVGTVLMFETLPTLPVGWEQCGYIRVSKGPTKDGAKSDHDFVCVWKVK